MKPLMLVTFGNEDYRLGKGKGYRLLYFLNFFYHIAVLFSLKVFLRHGIGFFLKIYNF